MTPFNIKASKTFPGVPWTGESVRHVSLSGTVYQGTLVSAESYISGVIKSGRLLALHDTLSDLFPAFEFHVSKRELAMPLSADALSQLRGKGPLQPVESIINPKTKNVFHLIATHENYIGGIRVWVVKGYSTVPCTASLCVRFRIEAPTVSRAKSKTRSRNTVEDPSISMELEGLDLEFNEPTTASAANKIELFEGDSL